MKKIIMNGREIRTNYGQVYYDKKDWSDHAVWYCPQFVNINGSYHKETEQEFFERLVSYGYSKIMLYRDKFDLHALCYR